MRITLVIDIEEEIVYSLKGAPKLTFIKKNFKLDDLPEAIREGCRKLEKTSNDDKVIKEL